ncbi:Peroxidase [Rhynchospora pubera]|uniref:Peroxidase n=1 Tax=Rhynchospora pubera TaxID=906938 RepID=A0AAV8D600_9POAL|nr:Peroxidase [Rhynchospora pubera]
MDSKIIIAAFLSFVPVLLLLGATEAHVEYGAYNISCPNAEAIVFQEMTQILATSPDLAGSLLRLHYVDCFVRGCEASILLNSTAGNTAEKDADMNKDVRGYDVIDRIKTKLEEACPGIVSCADIIALAARDSIRLSNGPNIPIGTGRRDGNGSSAADVPLNLPSANASIAQLISFFAKYNLTAKDLVVLSGAHTIGKAHCYSFSDRLYNYNGSGNSDPRLDASYKTLLSQECSPNDMTSLVPLDANNATAFDLGYYSGLTQMKGLLTSDAALLDDASTNSYVLRQANSTSPNEFFADFATSFMIMGKIGALTHSKGEIRRQCSAINPPSPSPSPSPSPPPPPNNSAEKKNAFSSFFSVGVVLSYLLLQYY